MDCGTPTTTTRCPSCTASHTQQRDATATFQRRRGGGRPGYNGAFRKEGGRVRATATRCWLCGDGPRPNDPWQADHVIPVSKGGEGGPLAPAHRSCNISRANKLRAGKPDPADRRPT